jgi:hypothetical protein
MARRKCCECHAFDSRLRRLHCLELCDYCNGSDKYRLISKSRAIKEHEITATELIPLYFKIFTTPGNHTYFLDSDIKDYILDRDASENSEKCGYIEHMEQKYNRRKQLLAELNGRGLQLRDDSKLCKQFIESKYCNQSLGDVVTRMCQMRYLYDYCNMERCFDFVSYDPFRDSGDKLSHFNRVEKYALDIYSGGIYPPRFPWEKPAGPESLYSQSMTAIRRHWSSYDTSAIPCYVWEMMWEDILSPFYYTKKMYMIFNIVKKFIQTGKINAQGVTFRDNTLTFDLNKKIKNKERIIYVAKVLCRHIGLNVTETMLKVQIPDNWCW